MKFVTNDYGCGTSSSILDYDNGKHAIIVSPDNWHHVLDVKEDICMVGHDFLLYMWDNDEKVKLWQSFQYKIYVWCFERINAIVPEWKVKSYFSISQIKKFAYKILACDESDCDEFGYDWLPQWASPRFFENKNIPITQGEKILFSGQSGKTEYFSRNKLLNEMRNDVFFKDLLVIKNNTRSLTEEEYMKNLLSYKYILNPIGVLEAFNVRSFEVLYGNRFLLQQVTREYKRHFDLIQDNKNCILFTDLNDLKEKLDSDIHKQNNSCFYDKNNIQSRIERLYEESN